MVNAAAISISIPQSLRRPKSHERLSVPQYRLQHARRAVNPHSSQSSVPPRRSPPHRATVHSSRKPPGLAWTRHPRSSCGHQRTLYLGCTVAPKGVRKARSFSAPLSEIYETGGAEGRRYPDDSTNGGRGRSASRPRWRENPFLMPAHTGRGASLGAFDQPLRRQDAAWRWTAERAGIK